MGGALLPLSAGEVFGLSIKVRSWLDIAPERRCACPLLGCASAGDNLGEGLGESKPLSDLVGLVLITVIDPPAFSLPPTNSLPPRRCPVRLGVIIGDGGESGGLSKDSSGPSVAPGFAPGLNEKSGRAEGRRDRVAASGLRLAPGLKLNSGGASDKSSVSCSVRPGNSTAERGRRPFEYGEEDEDVEGRAGNTNGGFGGGKLMRGVD